MAATSGEQAGVVLIHGAELGGWLWEPLIAHLRRPALAVDLPGREAAPRLRRRLRLDDAVAAVAADVDGWRADPVVLVAHSFAGVLVPGVAQRLEGRVQAVVWLGASVPVLGRSWLDLQPLPQRLVLRGLYRLRPGGVASPARQNRALLCNDLDEAHAAEVVARRVPEPPGFLLDPVRAALPSGVRSHYVRLLADRAQSQQDRERSIARLPAAAVHDLDAGHLPMRSQPVALAALLEAVAAGQDGGVEHDGAADHDGAAGRGLSSGGWTS